MDFLTHLDSFFAKRRENSCSNSKKRLKKTKRTWKKSWKIFPARPDCSFDKPGKIFPTEDPNFGKKVQRGLKPWPKLKYCAKFQIFSLKVFQGYVGYFFDTFGERFRWNWKKVTRDLEKKQKAFLFWEINFFDLFLWT